MRRKFTILSAAFALLAFLAFPMRMKAAEGDVHDMNISQSTLLNNNTAIPSINIAAQSYSVKAVTINWRYNKAIENPVTIEVLVGGTSWGTQTITGNTTADAVFNGESTIGAIVINFTNNTGSGTGHGTFYVNSVSLTEGEGGGPAPTTYTVTYHANVNEIDDIEETYNEGATVTIADNTFSNPGYVFTEWNTEADGSGDSYAPGDEIEDIDDNFEFYAQWEESSEITATLTQSNLELTGSYTTDTEKTIDGITYVYTDLMKSSSNIQAKANTGTVKNSTPYPGDIISVVITHSGTARATTINGSMDGTNWTQVATGSGSITADFSGMGYKYFQITRGSNAAYWEKIDIIYSAHASTQSESDLAITNASTDFTFDLYNNSTAQVINYTTSSTGAITITPASPTSYYSYVHDATAKTITVTPLAVTPSAQTVTISQEADENYYPGTTTFTVSVANSDPNMPGSFNNPYTVAQARAAIDANSGVTGVYATGIVSENNYFSSNNGYITYFISADGSTESDQLEAFHGMNFNGAVFTSADEIQVGDSVVIYGNLMKYHNNNTNTDVYEFESGNQLVFLKRPTPVLESYDLTVSALNEHINAIYVFDATDENNPLIVDGLAGTVQVLEGTDIIVSPDVEDGYVLQSLTVLDGEGESVQPENHMSDGGYYSFTMPSGNVTITAIAVEEVVPPTPADGDYVRITSLDQLTDGSIVVIAARYDEEHTNGYYAMRNATSGKPTGVLFTSTTSGNNETLPISITDNEDDYYWTVNVTENGYTFTNADGDMIGYGTSGTNFVTGGTNTEWTIESGTAGNSAMVAEYTGFVIKNYTTDARAFAFNGSAFGPYAWSNNNAAGYNFFLDFFVQSTEVTKSYTKHIDAYSDGAHWYLIASPLADETNPTDVENLIPANASYYALYRFNEGTELEWENYKAHTDDFMLEPGRGYLYANSTEGGVDLVFTGAAYDGDSKEVTLHKTAGAQFEGMNLVGNPFADTAYIADSRDFYTMDATGTGIMIEPTTGAIGPMEGIFVEANQDEERLTFTTQNPAGRKGLVLNLSQGRGIVDRAIVRFGEGHKLHKFTLNENSTKMYIPQDGEDFAVVRSRNSGEVTVSFEPAEDGIYSLSVDARNLVVRSLILTDKVERVNIDMLRTPSYQFKASKDNPADRFVLSYKTGSNLFKEEAGERSDFGFFNNGSWMIDNEGEATLQVIDVNGRILSSETINGNASIKVDAAPGVYMLRLINGDNVKVQKVVVK